jgi:hypothetical protein
VILEAVSKRSARGPRAAFFGRSTREPRVATGFETASSALSRLKIRVAALARVQESHSLATVATQKLSRDKALVEVRDLIETKVQELLETLSTVEGEWHV